MKKILLTSAGFENPRIGKEFLKLLGKPASEVKVLFIPTASRTKEELHYVGKSKKELIGVGIKKENFINFNLDRELTEEELKKIDVIYVCGGNTFYLLYKIRENRFDEKIKEMINKGIVYVGASAGSMIMGPDIEVSGIKADWDKNDVGLKDLTGLKFTDKRISPHYADEYEEVIKKFEEETGKNVTRLTDKQAILIKDEEVKILE
ncbi:MAG: Type 1 glutamine amidotransferase-like domain-containing protein [Candidatus Nanoarchaeia archaeon]|nr:Type 1 glutamine amidotransferase-like domain-containing protein [Candidatus Nanoarchaeia archaeon]MDD5741508.1 Type 1 glutamine amidotransferase-like domain-containing protein [Candidatus Nanoarchaeia archaeon]